MSDAASTLLSELSTDALERKLKWYNDRHPRFMAQEDAILFELEAREAADAADAADGFDDDEPTPPRTDEGDVLALDAALPPDSIPLFLPTLSLTKPSRTVVKATYKDRYKARGDARTCGDWMATTLAALVNDEERKLVVPAFERILEANGIEHSHWNRTTAGWQGRLRMTGRMALARKVAEAAALHLPDGTVIEPPLDWQMAMGA